LQLVLVNRSFNRDIVLSPSRQWIWSNAPFAVCVNTCKSLHIFGEPFS